MKRATLPPTPAQITAAAVTPQYAYVGGGASFLIGAAGTPILNFRWQTNGVNLNNGGRISCATSAMLTITNINANDALPTYSVIVTNLLGNATNSGLNLIVSPVPDGVLYAETFPYVGLNGNLPITEVSTSNANVVVEGSGFTIAPTVIGEGGRLPPTEVIDSDHFGVFNPTHDAVDFYESLEGMLVTIKSAQAVGSTQEKLPSAQGQPVSLTSMSCSSPLSTASGIFPRMPSRYVAIFWSASGPTT